MSSNNRFTLVRRLALFAAAISPIFWASGCATTESHSPYASVYRAAIASPARTDADRTADARRKPLAFLEYARVRPGMRILDVSAGDGYTTELLALVAGDQGKVWAQTPTMRQGFAARLKARPQANIVPVLQPFDDPVPHDAPPLDLVTLVFNYHDIANLPVDRAQMNARLFAALKAGGHMVVLDHAARDGRGANDTWTLHRIDEALVINELEAAGFRLEAKGDAFRNPEDPRTQRIFDMKTPVDNFALRFVKPETAVKPVPAVEPGQGGEPQQGAVPQGAGKPQ